MISLYLKGKLRFLFLLFFLLPNFHLLAQESITLTDSILPNTRGCERDPLKLVTKLTEGKKDEKAKFDAIFEWVTKNIRYGYNGDLSIQGTSPPRIDLVLKHKKGICLDYAYLMDTLCQLAGIENALIYGYAKDDLFDVNDSIYEDNHAWNAVKLNNKWYLYDATWSAGRYKRKYTRFSQFIANWKNKLSKRQKKTVTFKTRKTECHKKREKISFSYNYIPRKHRILLKVLSLFKPKVKKYFAKPVRPDFYLTNPEVFAITHTPDNPFWSLTEKYNNLKDYETDSAYYYITDNVYIKQQRENRFCQECDNFFLLDEMSKLKQMKFNSYEFNKRNKSMEWLTDYNISKIFYLRSLSAADSATKIQLIDSSLTYLSKSKDDSHKSLINIGKENQLQKLKNKKKAQIIFTENKKFMSIFHSLVASSYKEINKMNRFTIKTRITEINLRFTKRKLNRIGNKAHSKPTKFKVMKDILKIQTKYNKDIENLNLTYNTIADLRTSYAFTLSALSDDLLNKTNIYDSLSSSLYISDLYRLVYLLDIYKKNFVEERKAIKKYEDMYILNQKKGIFNLSDSCFDKGFRIFNLFEKRNKLLIESEKLLNVLVNQKIVDPDSLKDFIKTNNDRIQENICWIVDGGSKLKLVTKGYGVLIFEQKDIEQSIQFDNIIEYLRYRIVNNELFYRNKQHKNFPILALQFCTKRKNMILHYKHDYLKDVKDAKKKAKKIKK